MGLPAERVAALLVEAGYRRIDLPLEMAGLTFDIAGAFVGVGHSADLVLIGDMAADGERKVVQQVEGIARALDVMRSHRPLSTIIVGPRPIGKALEALAQVGRILSVDEALDPAELRDQLAVLLPLELPATLLANRDLGGEDAFALPDDPLAGALMEASNFGEEAVRECFHNALIAALANNGNYEGGDTDGLGEVDG
ncbi:hypothetical protein GRI39_12240 [Altererythrobacter indicus]|uniref:Uncharacterized protein n=2 Tax=Altericroceibacterium indicum TaxID=374177 RepID=A0A845ACU0_9SPHN|nr:hypothetical protein [Altericroceibacterium indicum]